MCFDERRFNDYWQHWTRSEVQEKKKHSLNDNLILANWGDFGRLK